MADFESSFAKLSLKANLVKIADSKRNKPLAIPEELYNKLYDYQKEGIRWLFQLYERGKGGILGDDMGLGKTVQMISFLTGLLECKYIRCALIVAPMSVINVWVESFKQFSPRILVTTCHGEKRVRDKALDRIQNRGGVLITTYDLVGREPERLGRDIYGDYFQWDYVVADEGHQLKNKSIKRSKGAHMVPTKYRVILTGTPLQNRMPELWALFDWTHFGSLLGSLKTFNENYGRAIEEGRKKCATARQKLLGNEFAENLRKIIEPYMLRRTKEEVGMHVRPASSRASDRPNSSTSDCTSVTPIPNTMPSLTRKNDLVVWLTLSKEQEDIYRRFLTTDDVKDLLDPSNKKSPLTQLIVLKKLCDHPRLLSENACETLGLMFDRNMGENDQYARLDDENGQNAIDDLSLCISQSIKTAFLNELLPRLVADGHKVLVFSMSLKMLNLVAQILKSRLNIKFLRLDGRITKLEERRKILDKYQTSDKYKVLLLTTQVGGVGLTITAADRVIIVDPAWNPAVDSQAVDRVYRVGQKRNVVIYRLITAGTVEEKIYRRQVFKVSIFKQIAHSSKSLNNLCAAGQSSKNKDDDPMRYFTQQDLKELFKLSDTKSSETQMQLDEMHSHQRQSDADLDANIDFMCNIRGVVGISDHDLLFSKEEMPTLGENEELQHAKMAVQRAKAVIEAESLRSNEFGHEDFNVPRFPTAPGGEQVYGAVGGYEMDNNIRTGKGGGVEPIHFEPMPSMPKYMQKYLKPGQKDFTPPKLLGRGQKEKSILHRSFSDPEIGKKNDPIYIIDSSSDDDAGSVDESFVKAASRRGGNHFYDDDVEDGTCSTATEPMDVEDFEIIEPESMEKSGQHDKEPEAPAVVVDLVNSDSEEDVQVIETPENVSASNSNFHTARRESIIGRPKNRVRRIIDDDDEDDEEESVESDGENQENEPLEDNSENQVQASHAIPTMILSTDTDIANSINSDDKIIGAPPTMPSRISSWNIADGSPGNVLGTIANRKPVTTSTPFGQMQAGNKKSTNTFEALKPIMVSPVIRKVNNQGVKRNAFERSMEVLNTLDSPDIVQTSVMSDKAEEGDTDGTGSTQPPDETDVIVDSVVLSEAEDYSKSEGGDTDATEEYGQDEDEDQTESRISIPQHSGNDSSFAY